MTDPRAYGIDIGDEVMTSRGASRIKWIGSGLVVAENGDHIDFNVLLGTQEAARRAEALKAGVHAQKAVDPLRADIWAIVGLVVFLAASVAIVYWELRA